MFIILYNTHCPKRQIQQPIFLFIICHGCTNRQSWLELLVVNLQAFGPEICFFLDLYGYHIDAIVYNKIHCGSSAFCDPIISVDAFERFGLMDRWITYCSVIHKGLHNLRHTTRIIVVLEQVGILLLESCYHFKIAILQKLHILLFAYSNHEFQE